MREFFGVLKLELNQVGDMAYLQNNPEIWIQNIRISIMGGFGDERALLHC